MSASHKGSGWERKLCKMLSLWWSHGESDACFWRTSTSGARATVRTRKGLRTECSYGDITAVDPIGQPLTRLFTIEAKKGYPAFRFGDLLESKATGQILLQFVEQAKKEAKDAGTPLWMLVVCKDRREPVVLVPYDERLFEHISCCDRMFIYYSGKGLPHFIAVRLEDFLLNLSPEHVKLMLAGV